MKRILILCLIFLMLIGTLSIAEEPATGTFRVIDGEWVNGEFVEWTGLRTYQIRDIYCDKNGECGIVTESYEDSNGAWTIHTDLKAYKQKYQSDDFERKAQLYDRIMLIFEGLVK